MSTNAHDVDPRAKRQQQDGGSTVAASAAPASAATSTAATGPVARLTQGDRTRFLSQSYTIPFAPITRPLSFDDASSWPNDPMEVFSQWYADGEFEYNKLSPDRMDAPIHWPNTMQISTLSPSGFPAVRTVLLKGFDGRGLVFFTNYSGSKGSSLLADPRTAVVFYWKTNERQVRMEGLAEPLSAQESDAYFHERPIQSQIGGVVSPQSRPIANHAELERAYVATVQAVAKRIQQHLDAVKNHNQSESEDAAANVAASIAEIEATKTKVSELLSTLSLQKAAASASSSNGSGVVAAVAPTPSAEELAATHAAHEEALGALQRLESSPLTASLLRAVVKRPPHWGGFIIRPQQVEFWCDGKFRLHSRILYQKKQSAAPATTTAEAEWTTTFLAP